MIFVFFRLRIRSRHSELTVGTMTTINYLEDFLLNSGPKQDCLVRICKYINGFDMMNLSESSKHPELFMEFFKDRMIDLNSFEFTIRPSKRPKKSFNEVFEHFGPCMQRIKVSVLLEFRVCHALRHFIQDFCPNCNT